MKKLFALVLALVMALSLVACGDKKDDSGDVTAEHTDTTTVAVGAVILARDDVSSDDVYKFVADIFDNAASLTTSHAKYGELSLEYGASITSVPYHPGAAKYFSEKGFEVASVKDGAGNTESRNLRFVTGGESGTYYAFGSVIAQHATNNAGINVINGAELTNVCCVVTRYFGGTLLGVGGLVRAYSEGAKIAVQAAKIKIMAQSADFLLRCGYDFFGKLEYYLNEHGVLVLSTQFGEDVSTAVRIRKEEIPAFEHGITELSSGKLVPQLISDGCNEM